MEVQKQFFERVKEELNITTEQLLTVPLKKYFELGGTGLMKANNSRKYDLICHGTVYDVIPCIISPERAVYPELKQIEELKPDYWKSTENQRKWIAKISKQLNITSPLDWAKVTLRTFNELGGSPLLNIYGSIRNVLTSCKFPCVLIDY